MNPSKETIAQLQKQIDALRAEVYSNNFKTSQDFQKYSRFNTRIKVPTYASAPTTCEVGELYVNTNGKLYVCSSANTWSLCGTQS